MQIFFSQMKIQWLIYVSFMLEKPLVCVEQQPVISCNCITGRVMIDSDQMICTYNNTIPNASVNTKSKIDYSIPVACPTNNPSVVVFLNNNSEFFCYDTGADCNDRPEEIIFNDPKISVVGCSIRKCIDDYGNLGITIYDESVVNIKFCSKCNTALSSCIPYGGFQCLDNTVGTTIGKVFDNKYCIPCAAFNGSSCSSQWVLECFDKFYKTNDDQNSCLPCEGSTICLKNKKYECLELLGTSCQNNEINSCMRNFFVSPDKLSCILCPEGANCTENNLLKCSIGQYIKDLKCQKCALDSLCDGLTQIPCYDVQGQSCVDGVVSTCMTGFIKDDDSLMCRQCGAGLKHFNNVCKACAADYLCDGNNEYECQSASNAISCSEGLIVGCYTNYLPNNLKTACIPCQLLGALTSNGAVALNCLSQYYLQDGQCLQCPFNHLCDGSLTKINCSNINDRKAAKCLFNSIIKCQDNHYLSNGLCLNCSHGNSLSFFANMCDGVKPLSCIDGFFVDADQQCKECSVDRNILECQQGKIIKCQNNFIPSGNGYKCLSCQGKLGLECDGSKAKCMVSGKLGIVDVSATNIVCRMSPYESNGSHIISCGNGFYYHNNWCISCYGQFLCDGVSQIPFVATNPFFALEYQDGYIKKCQSGFVLSKTLFKCIQCPQFLFDFKVICDGSGSFSCQKTDGSLGISYIDYRYDNQLVCKECPDKATCDGKLITRCSDNYLSVGRNCVENLLVPFCKQGESLTKCNCSGSVVFPGLNNDLLCDLGESQLPKCKATPKISVSSQNGKPTAGSITSKPVILDASESVIPTNCSCSAQENLISAMFENQFYCVDVGDTSVDSYALTFGLSKKDCGIRVYQQQLMYSSSIKCFPYNSHIVLPCQEGCSCNSLFEDSGYAIPSNSSEQLVVDLDIFPKYCLKTIEILKNGIEQLKGYVSESPQYFSQCQTAAGIKYCGQNDEQTIIGCSVGQYYSGVDFNKQGNIPATCNSTDNLTSQYSGDYILKCKPSGYIGSTEDYRPFCQTSKTNFVDGVQSTPCKDVQGKNCTGSQYITACQPSYYLSADKLVCIPCPISVSFLYTPMCDGSQTIQCYSSDNQRPFIFQKNSKCLLCPPGEICDGERILLCNKGFVRFDSHCVPCPLNSYCSGNSVALSCKEEGTLVCESNKLTCLSGYLLSSDTSICVKCLNDILCDGLQILSCSKHHFLQNGVCVSCPLGSSCDGVSIISCPVGQYIDNINNLCILCDININNCFCNGQIRINCSVTDNSVNAVKCFTNEVLQCSNGFIYDSKSRTCIDCSLINQLHAQQCNGTHILKCRNELFLEPRQMYCVDCSVPNLLFATVCESQIIRKCQQGYFLRNNQCFSCPKNINIGVNSVQAICSGNERVECYFNTQAGYSYFSASLNESFCALCPDGASCNGWLANCGIGNYVQSLLCQSCQINNVCNGSDQTSCAAANANLCENGRISECQQYHFKYNDTFCKECDDPNREGCSEYPDCSGSEILNGWHCEQCPFNHFCNGGDKAIDCGSKNDLNAIECLGNHILRCVEQFYLESQMCQSCPYGGKCDGINILQCQLGAQVDLFGKQCTACGLDLFCDGLNEMPCEQIAHSQQCTNGLISACIDGYVVDQGTTCVEKQNGGCRTGCIVGIVVGLLVVIIIIVVVTLVLKNKEKRESEKRTVFAVNQNRETIEQITSCESGVLTGQFIDDK